MYNNLINAVIQKCKLIHFFFFFFSAPTATFTFFLSENNKHLYVAIPNFRPITFYFSTTSVHSFLRLKVVINYKRYGQSRVQKFGKIPIKLILEQTTTKRLIKHNNINTSMKVGPHFFFFLVKFI